MLANKIRETAARLFCTSSSCGGGWGRWRMLFLVFKMCAPWQTSISLGVIYVQHEGHSRMMLKGAVNGNILTGFGHGRPQNWALCTSNAGMKKTRSSRIPTLTRAVNREEVLVLTRRDFYHRVLSLWGKKDLGRLSGLESWGSNRLKNIYMGKINYHKSSNCIIIYIKVHIKNIL